MGTNGPKGNPRFYSVTQSLRGSCLASLEADGGLEGHHYEPGSLAYLSPHPSGYASARYLYSNSASVPPYPNCQNGRAFTIQCPIA